MGKQRRKGADEMKEIEIKDGESWARCPICNVIWDTSLVLYGCYFSWDVENRPLPPAKLPQKLCPDHVEEIVIDGRRKGIRRTVYQDQLNEMNKNDLYCPACRSEDLQYQGEQLDFRDKLPKSIWICNDCNALIIPAMRYSYDENDVEAKIVYCFYREDLQTKELNEVWPDILRIIDSPGVKIKSTM
jgi:Zn finger protein HypA/HybF involved in hydrogenase expression